MFYLTTYIHPLSDPIVLSESLNIVLDNPRTVEEITKLEEYVSVSLDSPDEAYKHDTKFRIPASSDYGILSVESSLTNFYKNNIEDPAVANFQSNNSELPLLSQISRMWVILRFSDEGEIEQMKNIASQNKESGELHGFFLLDDDNPIEINASKAINYAHLLSLFLCPNDEYNGESFLLHKHYWDIDSPKIDSHLNMAVAFFGLYAGMPNSSDELGWRISLPPVIDKMRTQSELIELVLCSSQDNRAKLLYVSKLLKISSCDIDDENYKLVTYVGVLELLLTHNPNFMRFNVEDSISKQFQMKVATLVYLACKRSIPIAKLKKRLKTIYEQRSNIAHGNFKALDKYTQNLPKKEGEEEYFGDLATDTIFYIKCVLSEYLEDTDFVEFLKDS